MMAFVHKTYGRDSNFEFCENSLKGVAGEIVPVQNLAQVNIAFKRFPWYMVIYDNEFIDAHLGETLMPFLRMTKSNVIVLHKVEGDEKFSMCPRIFKSHLYLREDQLFPSNPYYLTFEHITSGWIFPCSRTT